MVHTEGKGERVHVQSYKLGGGWKEGSDYNPRFEETLVSSGVRCAIATYMSILGLFVTYINALCEFHVQDLSLRSLHFRP